MTGEELFELYQGIVAEIGLTVAGWGGMHSSTKEVWGRMAERISRDETPDGARLIAAIAMMGLLPPNPRQRELLETFDAAYAAAPEGGEQAITRRGLAFLKTAIGPDENVPAPGASREVTEVLHRYRPQGLWP